jgi:Restriction endonuclease
MGAAAVPDEYRAVLERLTDELGGATRQKGTKALNALVAMNVGARPEMVAKFLDWKDFEEFCASMLAARGYSVTRDLRLKKPRLQVDILARSPSLSLIVDCKHWGRERGTGALRRAVEMQAARAREVRKQMKRLEPMAVVILVLADEAPRFVDGAAVVPIRTLGGFVDEVGGLAQFLELY